MKRSLAVLFAAALAVLGLASPAAGQTQGSQRFIVFGSGSGEDVTFRVFAVGPITGVGRSRRPTTLTSSCSASRRGR